MKLTRMERRWAHAILGAMFPRGAAAQMPHGIEDLHLDSYLDDAMDVLPPLAAWGLRAGLAAINLAPPVTVFRPATFTMLTPHERERVLQALAHSPIYYARQLVVLIKTTGAMLYCGAPQSRAVLVQQPVRPRATAASMSWEDQHVRV